MFFPDDGSGAGLPRGVAGSATQVVQSFFPDEGPFSSRVRRVVAASRQVAQAPGGPYPAPQRGQQPQGGGYYPPGPLPGGPAGYGLQTGPGAYAPQGVSIDAALGRAARLVSLVANRALEAWGVRAKVRFDVERKFVTDDYSGTAQDSSSLLLSGTGAYRIGSDAAIGVNLALESGTTASTLTSVKLTSSDFRVQPFVAWSPMPGMTTTLAVGYSLISEELEITGRPKVSQDSGAYDLAAAINGKMRLSPSVVAIPMGGVTYSSYEPKYAAEYAVDGSRIDVLAGLDRLASGIPAPDTGTWCSAIAGAILCIAG